MGSLNYLFKNIYEAYWTQNLVQEESILTKNEYEIIDVIWWQLNSKPNLCLF